MNIDLSSQGRDGAVGLRAEVVMESHESDCSESLRDAQAIRYVGVCASVANNPSMETCPERRRRKLGELCPTFGGLAVIAEKALLNPVYLDQILKGTLLPPKKGDGTRTPRTLGDSAARAIEGALGLERGWLDNDHLDLEMTPRELQLIGYFRELDARSQGLVLEYIREAASRQNAVQEQIAAALQHTPRERAP